MVFYRASKRCVFGNITFHRRNTLTHIGPNYLTAVKLFGALHCGQPAAKAALGLALKFFLDRAG
jgi:hypothetical protein